MKRLLTNITLTVLITLAVACQQNTMSPRERTTSTIVTENEKEALAPVQLNWMGHWLYEDKRETLVRQVAQEFAFEQFQQTITNKYGSNVHYAADVGYLLGQEHKDLTQAVNAELRKLLTQQTTAQDAYLRIMSQVK
ncbi:MAG: hypothetical protein JW934_01955 [Anaerolineae bacterium]|nr:hypothetical protein [Anaerolineae bacterium]